MIRVFPILTAIFMLYLPGCESSSTTGNADVSPSAASSVERMPLAALADIILPAIEAQKVDSVESEILKLNPDAVAGTDTEWKQLETLLGITAGSQATTADQLKWYRLNILLCLKWVQSSPQSAMAFHEAADALAVTARNRRRASYLELFADGTPVADALLKVCKPEHVRDHFGTVSPQLAAVDLARQSEKLADKLSPPIEGPFYFALPATYLTEYADMLYEEGVFDESSLLAWKNAETAWMEYQKTPVHMEGVEFLPDPSLNKGTAERKKAELIAGFVDSQSWISRCQSFQERIYVDLHKMTFDVEESIRNGRKPAKKDLQVVVESWTTMFQLSPSLRTPRLLSRIAALQNGRAVED